LAKPEGVGSEFADVLIRLVDMADVFGIRLSGYDHLADLRAHTPDSRFSVVTFGDHMTWLHREISDAVLSPARLALVLRTLDTTARKYGIDLEAEYRAKDRLQPDAALPARRAHARRREGDQECVGRTRTC
jgi:hypothetical protein